VKWAREKDHFRANIFENIILYLLFIKPPSTHISSQLETRISKDVLAYACNSSYSGIRDWEDYI
jgi:hypothetical protein